MPTTTMMYSKSCEFHSRLPGLLGAMMILMVTGSRAVISPPLSDTRCFKALNLTGSCIPLNDSICMGGALPFKFTSLNLARDSSNLSDVYTNLQLWAGLRNVPQCWSVVQPFLCSVYLPKCDDSKGVELPSRELCERVRKPCKIVEDVKGWPDFLKCDDPNFVSGCETETYDKLIFNTSGKCEHPLVRTNNPNSWFEGVEGCGIPCDSPLFSKQQHEEVHIFVAVFGSICLLCTLFTVLTFIIDWKNANRYPALILFFINTCFFLGSIGWMAQFAGDARRDIVCRKDGTIRKGEPKLGSNESISCTMVFVIVYYFLVAGMSWFVMLAYAWYLTFVALGTPRDGLTSKTAYFHLVSWCSPLVLTIICLAISEVDGDSVSGICFVGGLNHGVRAVFVLLPVGLVMLIGTFFLLRGVYTLIQIRKEAPVFIPEKTFSKIRDTIIRLGVFTTMALVFVLITFAVHVYIFAYEDKWKQSFREYMYCIANVSVTPQSVNTKPGSTSSRGRCEVEERPSLVAMEIHIFAFFGAGIAMSSWSWTKSSLAAWERFFRWIFHKPSNKPVRLKRHRMIAQAFEKRKEINQGRVSISYRSSHDDPLGMKFDLNSCSDDDLSSTFAMAMPKLVRRRGGLIYPSPGIGRRYSDSDVQSVISTRRVSRESQFLEFREAQFVVFDRDELPCDPYGKKSRKKLKKKRGKLNRIKPVMGPMFSGRNNVMMMMHRSRKESDSSVISQMSAQSVQVPAALRMNKRCNSMETVSIESNDTNNNNDNNMDHDVILPAVTKSSHSDSVVLDQDSSTLRMNQFLKELRKDHHHHGKERTGGVGVGGGGGVMCGVGGAHSGMQEVLPGAVVMGHSEDKDGRLLEGGGKDQMKSCYNNGQSDKTTQGKEKQQPSSEYGKQTQFMNQRARRQSVALGMPGVIGSKNTLTPSGKSSNNNDKNNHSPSQKSKFRSKNQNSPCVKTTSSSSTMTVQKKKKTTKTLTTMEGVGGSVGPNGMDLSCLPFSPLMADIGGGNWGVLLGKSGSSSGSEAGGYGGYISGGSFYRPITHNLTPHHYNNHNYNTNNHQSSGIGMRESAFQPVHSRLHPSSSNVNFNHPSMNLNTNQPLYNIGTTDYNNTANTNGYHHLYHPSPYVVSPSDVLYGGGGYASNYMPGANVPHMGGATPVASYNTAPNQLNHHHPHHHPYPNPSPHQHNSNSKNNGGGQFSHGGARPKVVPENLGHFPAHLYYNGSTSNNNHNHQLSGRLVNGGRGSKGRAVAQQLNSGSGRAQKKNPPSQRQPMKGPNHSFFNSTFEVDDDVESISA